MNRTKLLAYVASLVNETLNSFYIEKHRVSWILAVFFKHDTMRRFTRPCDRFFPFWHFWGSADFCFRCLLWASDVCCELLLSVVNFCSCVVSLLNEVLKRETLPQCNLVLQNQKVVPEVPNLPLLPLQFFWLFKCQSVWPPFCLSWASAVPMILGGSFAFEASSGSGTLGGSVSISLLVLLLSLVCFLNLLWVPHVCCELLMSSCVSF